MSGRKILFVSGFSRDTRARDLAYEFERYGRLVRCDIPSTRGGGGASYAFVEFRSERDAEEAYHSMHGRDLDHKRISVQWARRPPSALWRHDAPRARSGRDRDRERERSRSRSYSPRRSDRDRDNRRRSRSRSRGRRDRDRDDDREDTGREDHEDRGREDRDDRDDREDRRRRSLSREPNGVSSADKDMASKRLAVEDEK